MQSCDEAARKYADSALLFKALGDAHRLAIVSLLASTQAEMCVRDLNARLPMNQSSVSHHLRVLKDAGIVTGARRGTWVYYTLVPEVRVRISDSLDTVLRR